MTAITESTVLADHDLAIRLAKLWPHREHEAPSFAGIFCGLGLHRWRSLDLADFAPQKNVRFCFWCSVLKIDGQIHEP